MKVEVRQEWEVPDSLVEVIIEMAGYGIGYWADKAEWDDEAHTYTVREQAEYGGYERVNTYGDLAHALVDVAYNPRVNVRSDYVGWAREALDEVVNREQFPGGTIDSDVADIIVQYAMFGDIVYG